MKCNICEFGCNIEDGKTGRCRMYACKEGKIVERMPDRFLAAMPINIETMPVLHFSPRGKFLQISTVGCNFRCDGCISNILVEEAVMVEDSLIHMDEHRIVKKAIEEDCMGIVFCLNDPVVSFFTYKKIAKLSKVPDFHQTCILLKNLFVNLFLLLIL